MSWAQWRVFTGSKILLESFGKKWALWVNTFSLLNLDSRRARHCSLSGGWGSQSENGWQETRGFRYDNSAPTEAGAGSSSRSFEFGSVGLIWGPVHLLLQGVNCRIQGGKLTLNTIAPHWKHGVLALLVLPLHFSHVRGRGAAELLKHWKLEATQAWLIFSLDVTTIFDWQPLKLALNLVFSSYLCWCRREAKECGDSFHESH